MYNKLFSKILDSSIWLAPDQTRLVWITLLAAMDEDGFVPLATTANVARRANVSDQAAQDAITLLESPDPATPECPYAGRRIERVEGGWMVLKAREYAGIVRRVEMLALNRERVRRSREQAKSRRDAVTSRCDAVTHGNAAVTERNGNAVTEQGAELDCNGPVMQSDSYSDSDVRTLPTGESDAPAAPSPSPAAAGKVLASLWNGHADAVGLPRCIHLSAKREGHCARRLSEQPVAYWEQVIVRIQASSFCRGVNDRGWVATFDWLVANADNAIKVLEGKYDDRAPVVTGRTAAAPAPAYQDTWTCEHDPTCPNREWHAMKMQVDQDGSL
jgi:hypothetical protein